MREILFRGKSADDDRWVYGSFVMDAREQIQGENSGEDGFIRGYDEYEKRMVSEEVQRETVCQYTGLTDKNGRKIFEGDIVRAEIKINDFSRDSVKNEINTYEVSYHEKYCYFYLKRKNNNLLFDGNWSYYLKEIEVIGNIFDKEVAHE